VTDLHHLGLCKYTLLLSNDGFLSDTRLIGTGACICFVNSHLHEVQTVHSQNESKSKKTAYNPAPLGNLATLK
jgi:hypothetical protein